MPRSSAQAGPVVGHEDGVDGIGRIVFYAGGQAGNEAVEAHLALEAGDVLRGVIGHAGNRVAVRDQMARAQVRKRTRSEEHTSELQSRLHLVCRLLLEKKKQLATVNLLGFLNDDTLALPG